MQSYIRNNFRGRTREQLTTLFLLNNSHGSSSEYPELLNEGSSWVYSEEFARALTEIKNTKIRGVLAPDFAFPDTSGKIHHLSDYKGKIVVVDTWHSGCGPCRNVALALKLVDDHFKDNPDVVILSICCTTTRENWLRGIYDETYSHKEVVNLWVDGDDSTTPKIPFLKSMFWSGDPNLCLIDKNGAWMNNPERSDGFQETANKLINQIEIALKNN